MEDYRTTIFIESPLFTAEDEERYKYVSTDVDDSGPLDQLGSKQDLPIHNKKENTFLDSDRFEDVDRNVGKHNPTKKTQFILRGKTQNQNNIYDDIEEERLEMERRSRSQRLQAEQNNIPQLDLVDSDNDDQTGGHCLDLELNDGRAVNYSPTIKHQHGSDKGYVEIMRNEETKRQRDSQLLSPQHLKNSKEEFYQTQNPPTDVRGFQPYQPYTLDNSFPEENNYSPYQRSVNMYPASTQRSDQFSNERRLIKMIRRNEPPMTEKNFIESNKHEVIKKDKQKKTYGEIFCKRRPKEDVHVRRQSEEVKKTELFPAENEWTSVPGNVFNVPNEPTAWNQTFVPQRYSSDSILNQPGMIVPILQQNGLHTYFYDQPYSLSPLTATKTEAQVVNHVSFPVQLKPLPPVINRDDPQKVSVDINLELSSPKIPYPLHHSYLTSFNPAAFQQMQGEVPSFDFLQPGNMGHMGQQQAFNVYRGEMNHVNVSQSNVLNTYAMLPPVGSSLNMNQNKNNSHIPTQNLNEEVLSSKHGGYMQQYEKQKNGNYQYKEYTIEDYRKLKKELKEFVPGKLGPELNTEERAGKKLKEQRKKQYSKQINRRNRLDLAIKQLKVTKSDDCSQQEESFDKRKIALDYAKTIRKPRLVIHSSDVDHISCSCTREEDDDAEKLAKLSSFTKDDIEELRELRKRHDLEVKQLELIELGMKTALTQHT